MEGTTAQLTFTAYPSNPTVTNGTRFSLAVDVAPNPDMHVYAPGAEAMGYRVIGFNMAALDAFTLSGSLDYQACNDAVCYPPAPVPISFTLELEDLDYQRANRR